MNFEEYKEKTNHAVELVKAINHVIGTYYTPSYAQSVGDTDSIISALRVFKSYISDTIDQVISIGNEYDETQAYERFSTKFASGKFDTANWSEIPKIAREQLKLISSESDSFDEAITRFKKMYGIKHIQI